MSFRIPEGLGDLSSLYNHKVTVVAGSIWVNTCGISFNMGQMVVDLHVYHEGQSKIDMTIVVSKIQLKGKAI